MPRAARSWGRRQEGRHTEGMARFDEKSVHHLSPLDRGQRSIVSKRLLVAIHRDACPHVLALEFTGFRVRMLVTSIIEDC